MNISQFDAATGGQFTAEITGESYCQRIVGDGYFIIISGGKHVSFSKYRHDVCFGDIVSKIIPNYTVADYVRDYGKRFISVPVNTETDNYKMPRYDGAKIVTIESFLHSNVFRHDKSVFAKS